MIEQNKAEGKQSEKITRRNVLKTAVAAGGAAVLGFPMIVKAQRGRPRCAGRAPGRKRTSSTSTRNDFAKKVNDMTGGDLKIEVLPAGAVVPAFGLLDAVSKGTLDGGHGVVVYHYGKQTALALWGSGPSLRHGCQHDARLAQVRRRQGVAQQALRLHRRQRRIISLRPDADAAARLVQKAGHQGRRFQGA